VRIITLNKSEFYNFFEENFKKNYHEASRQTGISPAQIHKIISGKRNAGLASINKIINWCTKNNKDYRRVIFMP